MKPFILLITIACFSLGCSNTPAKELKFDKIEIHHESAAVSPPYQRSYFIIAYENTVNVVIKGYKSTLLDTNFNNTSAQFEEYQKAYDYLEVGNATLNEDCDGCSFREIELSKDGKEVYSKRWNSGSQPGLEALVDAVINSIPNFGELLAREEKGYPKEN